VDSVLLHLTDAPLPLRPLGLVRLQREALHALCADCIGDDQGAKFNTLLERISVYPISLRRLGDATTRLR
jgi:hypothetical protein